MNDPEINLTMPLSKVNVVLTALSQRPWAEVHELVGDLGRQAQAQLQTIEAAAKAKAAKAE